MPKFKGISRKTQNKYERCVKKVSAGKKKRGRKKVNPYAVCYSSVVAPKKRKKK